MTLTEIMVSIRELSFDRYPIPVFVLKQLATKAITNNSTSFDVHPLATPSPADFAYTYTPNAADDKIQNLTDALIAAGYPIAYTGYYSALDAPNSLLLTTNASLATNLTFFRRFFLSDARIQGLIIDYFSKLDITLTSGDLTTYLPDLSAFSVRHLTLWCAIQLVELRRISEMGASIFSGNFTDGSGAIAGSNLSSPGQNISVSIGSVFSLTDDNSTTAQYFQEDFNRVGSDNVLGDKESFWFKLYLWLRDKLEREFKDFQFRGDNVIFGRITLEKDLNFNTYFDSYPFTFSAHSRGIIND